MLAYGPHAYNACWPLNYTQNMDHMKDACNILAESSASTMESSSSSSLTLATICLCTYWMIKGLGMAVQNELSDGAYLMFVRMSSSKALQLGQPLRTTGASVTVQNVQCCLWLLLVRGKLGGITFLLLHSPPLELNYCLRCSTMGMHLRIGRCTCMHLNGSTTLQMSKK